MSRFTACTDEGRSFALVEWEYDFPVYCRRGLFLVLDIWRNFSRAISRPDRAISERSRSNSFARHRNSLSILMGIRNV
jgi:hypothetical protein